MFYCSWSEWQSVPWRLPTDNAIYAIADIHGCSGHLRAMHRVLIDAARLSADRKTTVVHLGDNIERGPHSCEVLEILSAGFPEGLHGDYLVGNHDQYLVELLSLDETLDKDFIRAWYDNGGEETMRSIGVDGYGRLFDSGKLSQLSMRVRTALGENLVRFLERLKSSLTIGDYVFVHAGIDPRRSL